MNKLLKNWQQIISYLFFFNMLSSHLRFISNLYWIFFDWLVIYLVRRDDDDCGTDRALLAVWYARFRIVWNRWAFWKSSTTADLHLFERSSRRPDFCSAPRTHCPNSDIAFCETWRTDFDEHSNFGLKITKK